MSGSADVVRTEEGTFRLKHDYENHVGDKFKQDEIFVKNKLGQLHRPNETLGGPAIAFYDIRENLHGE